MPRKKRKAGSDFITRVNETVVTAELLGEVLELNASMPPEDRAVFEVRAIRLFELLDSKGLTENRAVLSMAVDFRLTALARLDRDGLILRGWSMPGAEPGLSLLHSDVLKAVAEEPLIEDQEGFAAFDAESLQRRVLAYAKTAGEG